MKKYGKNKYVIGSVVLILVCLMLTIVSGRGGNSPEGVVKTMEKALNSGNEKKLLSCYSSELAMAFKMEKTFDSEASLMETLGFPKGKIKILVESVEMISDSEADVSGMIIYTEKESKNESVSTISLNMEKENGKWIINY